MTRGKGIAIAGIWLSCAVAVAATGKSDVAATFFFAMVATLFII